MGSYQGKFSSRENSQDIYALIEQRSQKQKAAKPGAKPPAPEQPGPAKAAAPARRQPETLAPKPPKAAQAPRPEAQPAPASQRVSGRLIFWTCFFGFTFLFYLATYIGLGMLQGWLVNFEQAQPTAKSAEVFEAHFRSPDWEALYDLAGLESSNFEDKADFCAYMEAQVAGQELTMLETSTGLSQDKKYLIRLGEETISTFTLVDNAPEGSRVPDWQLGKIELLPKGSLSFRIRLEKGAVAYVNGVALGEDQAIMTAKLPLGSHVPTFAQVPELVVLRAEGLLTTPTVTIRGADGEEAQVRFEEETGTFLQADIAEELPQDRRELSMNALKAYVVYMATKGGGNNLAKYFDTASQTYKDLTSTDRRWTQEGQVGYSNETVEGYHSYGDDLFSVWAGLDLNITRPDGSVKTTRVEQTLFFTPNAKGSWVCYDMTSENLSLWETRVKLTFTQEGQELLSGYFLADGSDLTCPIVSAPEGKTFTGWVITTQDAAGNPVLKLMLTPDESGNVTLPAGATLEPMVLEPLFE